MFNWDGCPQGLFDRYIEVGEVKKSKFQTEDYVFIEIWVTSSFASNCIREECRESARRPIYGVLKQIKEMCGERPGVILFMCDDMQNDTILWTEAILLLHRELKNRNIVKHSVLFARDSKEETENFVKNACWHSDKTKEKALRLPKIPDAVIYGRANCYVKSENAYVYSKTSELPDEIKNYIQFTLKDL